MLKARQFKRTETETTPSIWVLFWRMQNYEGHESSLLGWWLKRPSIDMLRERLGYDWSRDDQVLRLAAIYRGEIAVDERMGDEYILTSVAEGSAFEWPDALPEKKETKK